MKDITSVTMLVVGPNIRRKFKDSEIIFLQKLVHQECKNGVITENRLRKIYDDIFPMVSKQFSKAYLGFIN